MHCDTKHIIFLQAAHTATDERVCYHQAQALRDLGHVVDVYGMDSFRSFEPQAADVYIVDTPIALWKIRRVSAKIIYDVTEWYPSKKNLRNARFSKLVKAIVLMMASVWAGYRCSAFIFGEYDKAKPFRFLFPRKKHISNRDVTLYGRFIGMLGKVYGMTDIVSDTPNALHFNDLLYSTCYIPYYSWCYNCDETQPVHFSIGGSQPRCGPHFAW